MPVRGPSTIGIEPVANAVFDFDGTLSSKYNEFGHRIHYPECGAPIPLSLDCVRLVKKLGYVCVVVTAREDLHPFPDGLTKAKEWLVKYGYAPYIDYVNEPPPENIAVYGWRGGKIPGTIMFEDREFTHDGGDYDWGPAYAYLRRLTEGV